MQRNAIKTCLEPRLHRRYLTLLRAHMRDAPKLAPGVASSPAPTSSFAATQAAWRFLNNERVTLATLAEPIRSAGVQGCASTKSPFCILVHDWCKITYEPASITSFWKRSSIIQALSQQLARCSSGTEWNDVAIVRSLALNVTLPWRSSVATCTLWVGC